MSTRITEPDTTAEAQRMLAIYLRDHHAGSAAGLSLVRRCRSSNAGTELGDVLEGIEREILDDQRSLEAMMARLGVERSRLKSLLGAVAEIAGRVKSNGRLVRYSPSSRVVELEMLAAGIVTKRGLWLTLASIAPVQPALDPAELDELIRRATSQHERVMSLHQLATAAAFRP